MARFDSPPDIRIAVVLGTSRPGSYTSKALGLLMDELQQQGIPFDVIEPDDAVHTMSETVKRATQIGAIKSLEHLRSVCSHVGAIVLPGPVSVAKVQAVFDEDGNCTDPGIERRIRGVVTNLTHYIHDSVCPKAALEAAVRGDS